MHNVVLLDASENPISAVADDAVHLVSYFADVSGNRRINAVDAAEVARVAALIDGGFGATLLTDPAIVGDISGDVKEWLAARVTDWARSSAPRLGHTCRSAITELGSQQAL